jgi:hypothetical protein
VPWSASWRIDLSAASAIYQAGRWPWRRNTWPVAGREAVIAPPAHPPAEREAQPLTKLRRAPHDGQRRSPSSRCRSSASRSAFSVSSSAIVYSVPLGVCRRARTCSRTPSYVLSR